MTVTPPVYEFSDPETGLTDGDYYYAGTKIYTYEEATNTWVQSDVPPAEASASISDLLARVAALEST